MEGPSMDEATQPYHAGLSEDSRASYARAVACMAMFEARKAVRRKIRDDGIVKLSQVPPKEISARARALVEGRRAEFIERAKGSGVVRDTLRQLYAREALKLLRKLARNSTVLHKERRADPQ
jgi:hypothetical protein